MTMTMPYQVWVAYRSCQRKKIFGNEPKAQRHAERSADLYGEPREAWHAYPCDNHPRQRWHIGHKGAQ